MSLLAGHGVMPAQLALLLVLTQPPSPIFRPVASPSAVTETGVEPRTDSATATVAPTPGFALADLDLYDMDVKTAFSLSAPGFPAESLVAARAGRAQAWLRRMPATGRDPLMDPVLRAEVEGAAGDDEAAERLFAAALASATRGRRSYVLLRATTTFADGQRDDSALARRLPVAERYLARLMALPQAGYATAYDSLQLVDRAYQLGALAVLAASARLGDTARVAAHIAHALTTLRRYTGLERVNFFTGYFPCEAVVTTLLGQSHGQARVDSLTARVLALVALTPAELAALPAEDRPKMPQAIVHDVVHRIAAAALLGHRAPPLTAHAWLDTPDSLYQPAPRAHELNDGTIRLLYLLQDAWWLGGTYRAFPILSRLHDAIAPWGQVVVVTHTEGHAGTDLVEPADEVAWLTGLYRDQARRDGGRRPAAGAAAGTVVRCHGPVPCGVRR